jgi:hypothetical protein
MRWNVASAKSLGRCELGKQQQPPRRREFSAVIDGKLHTASWILSNGWVTVSGPLGAKTTELGKLDPDALARLMLTEMVKEKKQGL